MNELIDESQDEASAEQERLALHAALDQLDPLDAQIMRELHGIECEEQTTMQIAERHKVSAHSINKRKNKIIRKLGSTLTRSDVIQSTVQTVSPTRGSWAKKTGFWEGRAERDQAKGASLAPTEGRTNFPVDQMTDEPKRYRKLVSLWQMKSWAWNPDAETAESLSRGDRKIRAYRAKVS